ncbi:MAG: GNAT family N-acetyltransferase [Longimicrobiales bacterium]
MRTFQDAAAFLQHAGDWMLTHEAEHNLLIGLVQQLVAGTALFDPPFYLATVEKDGAIVGCAFRTPPYKLGLTRMPSDAVPALVKSVASAYNSLNAVMGDETASSQFAHRWSKRSGSQAVRGMVHRIYELHAVTPPSRMPLGVMRLATTRDTPLVARWIDAFSEESGVHTANSEGLARARIKQSALYLWEVVGVSVSMAAWSGETPHGRRVGYVYTPTEHRARGYATALVAQLSTKILEDGCRFCFLYTDLANPTSNSIYQQIGYQPICDVTDWVFV